VSSWSAGCGRRPRRSARLSGPVPPAPDPCSRVIDPRLTIHLIMDNGSSHVAKATKKWLAEHPRCVAHHTPTHASWHNQVELVFSILTRRLLRRDDFASRDELVAKIMAWITEYNRNAKPFAWTYNGSPLKVA
jgi:transposase